ncbi:MAG TPA: hypothetical protein DEO34_06295 [Gammaproteobacteria bacterium]|nr:hypothetical protein [Gammaproteobacteria bacterium]
MQVSAIAKRLQISPQKVRLVADQVRGKPVADALDRKSTRLNPSTILPTRMPSSA